MKLQKTFGHRILVKFLKTLGISYLETDRNFVLLMSKREMKRRFKALGFDINFKKS